MNDVFITYRHFRLFDEKDGEMLPKGGATLAFFVDLRDPENRHAIVGWALCSPEDHFSKSVGRQVAYTTLNFIRRQFKGFDSNYVATCRFEVEHKEDGGTLCAQFLTHIEGLYDSLNEGDELYLLSRWLRRHNII